MKQFFTRRLLGLATLGLAASLAVAPTAGAECNVLSISTGSGGGGYAVCALNVWLDHNMGTGGGSQCMNFGGEWYFVSVDCGVVAVVNVS